MPCLFRVLSIFLLVLDCVVLWVDRTRSTLPVESYRMPCLFRVMSIFFVHMPRQIFYFFNLSELLKEQPIARSAVPGQNVDEWSGWGWIWAERRIFKLPGCIGITTKSRPERVPQLSDTCFLNPRGFTWNLNFVSYSKYPASNILFQIKLTSIPLPLSKTSSASKL